MEICPFRIFYATGEGEILEDMYLGIGGEGASGLQLLVCVF
jgi:hypothetical protein